MQVSIIMIIIFNHCFFTCRVLIRNPKLGHCLLHSYSKLRYVASHKYFKSSGRKGLLVPYKFLNCTKTDQYLGVFGGQEPQSMALAAGRLPNGQEDFAGFLPRLSSNTHELQWQFRPHRRHPGFMKNPKRNSWKNGCT